LPGKYIKLNFDLLSLHVQFRGCPPVNPCLNGALCRMTLTGYQCECTAGFTGTLCQVGLVNRNIPHLRERFGYFSFRDFSVAFL